REVRDRLQALPERDDQRDRAADDEQAADQLAPQDVALLHERTEQVAQRLARRRGQLRRRRDGWRRFDRDRRHFFRDRRWRFGRQRVLNRLGRQGGLDGVGGRHRLLGRRRRDPRRPTQQ